MLIVCKNDFPFMICPLGTDLILARKITKYLQEQCGQQLGLVSPTYYHIQEADLVPEDLIEQLEMENENGSNETNHTEATEIGCNDQTPESTEGESGDDSTSKEL